MRLPHSRDRRPRRRPKAPGDTENNLWRGLAPAMTQQYLVDGLDRVSRRLGGLTRTWGSIGWRPSATPTPAGSRPASLASPNTMASGRALADPVREPKQVDGERRSHCRRATVAHAPRP
ncbi:hypothetical protein RHA1_ro08892 (plasmid) [Rhodococcus jostii RHA1]|uniref:Uncharacterized protein n=1 Tax=Rhodococcus jostii (strain RHA1) TaxID=101510 RepID=Q0RXQ0_RHOJR|nr:hypothetical protein RHA1_ro08892 [Rhodococcus jostii RHA1]